RRDEGRRAGRRQFPGSRRHVRRAEGPRTGVPRTREGAIQLSARALTMSDVVARPDVAPVTDRRPVPRGVLPRGMQTWLMVAIALGTGASARRSRSPFTWSCTSHASTVGGALRNSCPYAGSTALPIGSSSNPNRFTRSTPPKERLYEGTIATVGPAGRLLSYGNVR